MVVGAVAHNLLSLHECLNSPLTILSNFTQLFTGTYSDKSGKLLPVQPQRDLQVSWSKVWFGEWAPELPGRQKLEAPWHGRGRDGCWLLGDSTSSSGTWLLFCQEKYQPGMMLPRIRNIRVTSNFRAERGSRGSANITIYLAHGNKYTKVDGKMTEEKHFLVFMELALESERPKISSQRLAGNWRWDLEME